jgi:hypothetical protein
MGQDADQVLGESTMAPPELGQWPETLQRRGLLLPQRQFPRSICLPKNNTYALMQRTKNRLT